MCNFSLHSLIQDPLECYAFVIPLELETLVFSDEDSEIDDGEDGPYDPSFDELITHDCQNIREFNKETIKEDMGRFKFNGHVGFTKEDEKRKKHPWAKWNHAYGIPILGRKEFTDDSMKRACYLIR